MPARLKRVVCILAAVFAPVLALAPAARAKVIFTGYGDFRLNAHTPFQISGDKAALATLALTDTAQHHARGFSFDSVGLFAATSISDNMDFKVDFNYRNIGQTVGQLRLQYADFEHRPTENFSYRVGKITLPFGYYNQNRFYSFQRVELQSPVFQTAILGLPIADLGAGASMQVPRDDVRWVFDAYTVNGYGGQPADPTVFRSPTLLNGTVISNNLGANNKNAALSYGARVAAADIGGKPIEAGLSYLGGAWDPSGSHYFQLWNAHFHSGVGRLDVLTELLHLDVSGDRGFAAAVGDTHWQTSGAFVTASLGGFSAFNRPLTPYLGAEGYRTTGHHSGGSQEKLQAYRAGAQLKPHENIALKAEYAYFYYALPQVGLGNIRLWAHEVLGALVVTF